MGKGRVEAFSDGVIAILMTIMVLGLREPQGSAPADLIPVVPRLLTYLLSFVFLGIYWSNHHHLFQAVRQVNGRVLWANLHLLFWLSLIPFVTGWVAAHSLAALPVAVYGVILFLAAAAYFLLVRSLTSLHGDDSSLTQAIGRDVKGKGSIVLYAIAIPLSSLSPIAAWGVYVLVALIWLVPDRRMEKALTP